MVATSTSPETEEAEVVRAPTSREVASCSYTSWATEALSEHTFPAVSIPLEREFVEYLLADGVFVAADNRAVRNSLVLATTTAPLKTRAATHRSSHPGAVPLCPRRCRCGTGSSTLAASRRSVRYPYPSVSPFIFRVVGIWVPHPFCSCDSVL